MKAQPSLEDTIKRTRRYWYVDGLVELTAGVIIWLLAILFALQPLFPANSRNWLLAFGQPAIIILGTWGANKVVQAAKQRLTYRRTGYVAYRRNEKASGTVRAIFIIAAVLAGMLAAVLAARGLEQRWIPLLMGTLMGVFMLYISWQMSLPRFSVLSAFIFLSGAAVSWLALDEPWDMSVLFGLFGASMVISGLWTLRSYLKKTQPLLDEESRNG